MSSSRISVERLSTPPMLSDAGHTLSEAPEAPPSPSLKASSPELTPLTTLSPSIRSPEPPRLSVFIELPTLSRQAKAQYATDLPERVLTAEEEFPEREMRGILGEHQTESRLYYFVQMTDSTAFKFNANEFNNKHPQLVEEYKRKKVAGELAPFDPSDSSVHPSSRIRNIIKIRSNAAPLVPTQVSDAETDELNIKNGVHSDSDDAYSESEESDLPSRRTTRATAAMANNKKQLRLPFSPKKTRSRQVIPASDDENEPITVAPRPRRSTRAKTTRSNLDDDDYSENDDDSDEFVQGGSTIKAKKKAVRGKASRPTYGHFRTVADLDYDEDEDTAILRAHRDFCERCELEPTHILLQNPQKNKGKRKRKSRKSEDESDSDENSEERVYARGGWVRCMKCPVTAHWGCLAQTQRDEILRAALEKDRTEWRAAHGSQTTQATENGAQSVSVNTSPEPAKRAGLNAYETTEFICGQCMKGGVCMGCTEVVLQPDAPRTAPDKSKPSAPRDGTDVDRDTEMAAPEAEKTSEIPVNELLFRCWTCKRLSHYAHLPLTPMADPNEEYTALDRAFYYQVNTNWQCADCISYVYQVEHIVAWRPFPPNAVEPPLPPGEVPNYKAHLPREYLVKWVNRSYRRIQWVPHMWLVATHHLKLKNFLNNGSRVLLLPEPVADASADAMQVDDRAPDFATVEEEGASDADAASNDAISSLEPLPDADKRVQLAWKTVDRVLDVLLWSPQKRLNAMRAKDKTRNKRRVVKRQDNNEADEFETEKERDAAFDDGEQPSEDFTETVDEWERRNKRALTEDDIGLVVWGFFKWHGLGYDDATWDSPPREGTSFYKAFQSSFQRFLASQKVVVPKLSRKEVELLDRLPPNIFMKRFGFDKDSLPQLGQSDQLNLMPFQVDGVNWLCNNWWNRQHCILADEMGLGKTVQIVTFLGTVIRGGFKGYEQAKAQPALVVVPNSTITNWIREFERWAPQLRVVPFYGDARSREVVKQYELFHSSPAAGTTGAKFDVLVTTYETVTNAKEFTPVFKATPRWEVLVVDEGQRLKSDSSLIFRKLKELNTIHRIILTGTPLNNNIRELFNLMNFLDPHEWRDLENLAKEHEVLTEESVKELHIRLRPYFLRRIKSEVLELPPKNEVIVPVSMSPLQKEIYRSILSQNLDLLRNLAQSVAGSKVNAAVKKSNLNNMLMQLRKCLQHPYLVSRDIEPEGLSLVEAHEKLISASAKLRFLQALLPKLKARGHRVLLFSQFVIALDIVEDFLRGEGIKFLRLDGNTKQADRQKDMDEFNKPDSDVFIYILSTRAGGVGINLWTADTVIIFDPDFNPHQDLQAIARAHRYGQKKTCLVFKLMVKESAEERIMQNGKKKLVLDHLIVQKMDDDDDTEDVKSILMFGAQALFQEGDEQSARDIQYSEHDIEKLIEKTEKEGDQPEPQAGENLAFSFAKVWAADKDSLEDINDTETQAQEDAWAQTLARIAEKNAKERAKELTGRGVRRKAAPAFPNQYDFGDSPKEKSKKRGKRKSKVSQSDEDIYKGSGNESEEDSSDGPASATEGIGIIADLAELGKVSPPLKKPRYVDDAARGSSSTHPPLSPLLNRSNLPHHGDDVCGLCRLSHPEARCFMTESSENLAQYRNILLTHAGDEPLEDRQAAIEVIDETLYKRGHMHLIYGQPLYPVDSPRIQTTMHVSEARPSRPIIRPQATPVLTSSVMGRWSDNQNTIPSSSISDRLKAPGQSSSVVAGPTKRPASPRPLAEPPKKKPKESDTPPCVVCGKRPLHLLKSCPVLTEGSARMEKELKRLSMDASVPASTVDALRKLLERQSQREALARSAGAAGL